MASFEDARVPGQGLNTVVRHVHNAARGGIDSGAGAGWTLAVSDLDAGLEAPLGDVAGAITGLDLIAPLRSFSVGKVIDGVFAATGQLLEFTDDDGTTHRFVRSGGPCARWQSPPGVSLKVREIYGDDLIDGLGGLPEAYELIRPDGVVYRAERLRFAGVVPTTEWRVTSVTDRRGNQLSYDYDRLGALLERSRLRSITHNRFPDAPVVRFDYTALGDLDRIVTLPALVGSDPASGVARSWERQIDYDIDPVSKQLRSVTDNSHPLPSGAVAARRTTSFSYGAGNALSAVTDGRGNTTRVGYTNGRVTSILDRRGKTWSYGYTNDAAGQTTTTATSPVGSATTYRISPRAPISSSDPRIAGGNIASITDAGHGDPAVPITTSYGWTANRLTSSTDGAGAQTTREYNDLGLLTRITEPAPNAAAHPAAPEAVTAPVTSTLQYAFPPDYGEDPDFCAPPPSSGPVSTEGWCFAVGELVRATVAENHPAQRRMTDFTYDGVGNLTRATLRAAPDPASPPDAAPSSADRSTANTHYARGGVKTIDGPRTDVADVTTVGDTADATYGGYDRAGMPTRVTDAAGKAQVMASTPYGSLAKMTDRDGRARTWRYDERDNVVEATDPLGHTQALRYDGNDNKTHDTSPRGTQTATVDDFTAVHTYDANDWMTETSTPGAAGGPRTTVRSTYADDGAKASETSARGATTTFAYWPNRMLRTVDAPASGSTRAISDTFYDAAGRVARTLGPVTNAAGARPETVLSYNPDSSVSRRQETSATASPRVTRYAYNAHGEEVRADGPRTLDGVEAATTRSYDTFGQLTLSRRRLGADRWLNTTTGYDSAGNQTRVSQPTGAGGQLTSTYAFDALGRLAAQTADPVNPGHTVAYAYDGEGKQTRRTDLVDGKAFRVSTSTYNPDDTLQTMVATDFDTATGLATARLATCNFVQGQPPASGYDADRNLLETRTVSVAGPGSGADLVDCDTGVLERRQSFAYDERGWMSSSTQALRSPETNSLVTRTQSFAYDPDAKVSSATHATPGGASYTTGYAYTEAGWMAKATDWRAKESTTSYLASGVPATQALGGGVASASFDWHPDGMPRSLTWRKGSAGAVVRRHANLAYDQGALRTSEDVSVLQPGALVLSGAQASYTYDLAERLTGWTSPFVDVGAGDRLRSAYVLDDGANLVEERITTATTGAQVAKVNATYPNGRLAERRAEVGVVAPSVTTDTFSYDGLGQERQRFTDGSLTTATAYDPLGHTRASDDATAANADVSYVYDTADRLVSRSEPGAPGDRPRTTLYFYWGMGETLAEEADGAGRTLVRYLSDDQGQALAQQSYKVVAGAADPADTAGTWRWLLPDVNANVATHLSDSGEVLEQAAFDPYGRPEKAGSSQTDKTKKGSTLGFQGAITDKVTGSVVLGPRLYDPATTRFTTADTFVAGALDLTLATDPLTGNRYLFAGANPVAFFDNGHHPIYKEYRQEIQAAARESRVDAALLGAIIQHEGHGRFHWMRRLGRRLFYQLELRLGRGTVGVAQIAVTTDKMKLAEQAGLGKFKSLTEFRAKLVRDDAFSIRVAAAYLRNLQAREGVTGRRAFIAYAYSSRGIEFLRRYRFSPRAATADALACGGTCSDVSLFNNLIGRHYTYMGIIGGVRREFDDGS